jgi:hypothetical protein
VAVGALGIVGCIGGAAATGWAFSRAAEEGYDWLFEPVPEVTAAEAASLLEE